MHLPMERRNEEKQYRHAEKMKTKTIENIIIAVIWTVVFACPLLFQYYLQVVENAVFDWQDLKITYTHLASLFLLFLVHHFLVIPFLYARKRYLLYGITVGVMLSCYVVFMKASDPHAHPPRNMMEHPIHHDARDSGDGKPEIRKATPHDSMPRKDRHLHKPQTSALLSPFETVRLIIALLMLGMNLGADAMIKTQEQRRRLNELEQQNLKQELEYLKHQINPHFFMNTLNNIHALIDIDQEKAKRSIVELSKLMRYMLYDGNGSLVKLSQEVDFITQYLSLMKLRYSNKVEIVSHMPDATSGIQIPPLLLVTFIENAFKHGISYQQQSFVHIVLSIDEAGKKVLFTCSNSRHRLPAHNERGGIGLENVRKRLDLIYAKDYRLEVDDGNPEQFTVTLEMKSL